MLKIKPGTKVQNKHTKQIFTITSTEVLPDAKGGKVIVLDGVQRWSIEEFEKNFIAQVM
jgi:hypothetical protein